MIHEKTQLKINIDKTQLILMVHNLRVKMSTGKNHVTPKRIRINVRLKFKKNITWNVRRLAGTLVFGIHEKVKRCQEVRGW